MGAVLILVGVIIWIFLSPLLGLILVVAGVLLFFVPGVPYGYSTWHGRRRGPP